jgi:glyoxylate carboligase
MERRHISALAGPEGDTFGRLLDFLNRLDQCQVHYSLRHTRPEPVMVDLALPGQRWEVEFMNDNTIEIERYESMASVENNPALLDDLLAEIDRPRTAA